MTVLITYASRHGSTAEIAERIGAGLRAGGHHPLVVPVAIAPDPGEFEAVIVGSAVYMGRWMKEATEFMHAHLATLGRRPVWVFSSGPVGLAELPEAKEVAAFMETLELRDHRTFDGALDLHKLSLPERLIVRTVKAPAGDFRRWAEVDAWAAAITAALGPPRTEPPPDTTPAGERREPAAAGV